MSKGEPTGVGTESSDSMLSQSRLMMVLQAFAAAPADQDIPNLVISQAIAAGPLIRIQDSMQVDGRCAFRSLSRV